jgi:SRSO17 transposase
MDGGVFPRVLQSVLASSRELLSGPQRKHLRWFVFGLLMNLRSAKLLHVASVAPRGGHRTSCGRFLKADWDCRSLIEAQAMTTLRTMRPRAGEPIYLIIDDTRIEKRGKSMEAVSKIYDHKTRRFIHGHIVVSAAIMFRGVVLPWRFELWVPKEEAGDGYRKFTQLAAAIVNDLQLPWELKVRVLFDAFYLSPCVIKACNSQGFTWFSVASKNRKLQRKHCGRRSIKQFASGVLRHHGKRVRLRRARFWRWMRIAHVDGELGRVGRVRMVLSKRPGDPWKKTLAVVTNETGLPAREIMTIYERRWQIEVLFKELRSSLGLCDYQVLSRHAIERHLHLCGIAHQVLTHHSLQAQGANARQQNQEVALPRFSERFDDLRSKIQMEQAKVMLRKIKSRSARTAIREYLQNEMQIAA